MTIRQGLVAHTNLEAVPAIEFAAERGFDYVELDMESAGARRRVDPASVREASTAHDVDLVVHLPYRLDIATPHEHVREGAFRELEAAIDAALEYGATKGVYHAGTFARTEVWDEELLREQLRQSVERLTTYANERDFLACVENLKSSFSTSATSPNSSSEPTPSPVSTPATPTCRATTVPNRRRYSASIRIGSPTFT